MGPQRGVEEKKKVGEDGRERVGRKEDKRKNGGKTAVGVIQNPPNVLIASAVTSGKTLVPVNP